MIYLLKDKTKLAEVEKTFKKLESAPICHSVFLSVFAPLYHV